MKKNVFSGILFFHKITMLKLKSGRNTCLTALGKEAAISSFNSKAVHTAEKRQNETLEYKGHNLLGG